MPENISIRKFTEADFPNIITISNKRFGVGYIDQDELHAYLNNDKKIGLVAEVNHNVAGFALAQVVDLPEMLSLILSEHEWFRQQFVNKNSIGILKTIAVNAEYSDQGIGTALTQYRIEILKERTNVILAISWQQKQDSSNTKILEKFGLLLKRKIENYWSEDSVQKGYNCKQCGARCKCTALIYTK